MVLSLKYLMYSGPMYIGGLQVIRNTGGGQTMQENIRNQSLGLDLGVCVCVCVQTYAECQVEQSHPDVQSEEEDDVGHLAEQDDVPHVLLHSDCRQTDR